ncbi:hypothetical protein TKK_0012434 [Trichogramma kaykai]|uniref:PiggyBac transposable element-derived protein domain-containing protein n=1 Tax=Trichogramma kaykai TaxID=54128 RepID=A0ABD2WN21_9HYME
MPKRKSSVASFSDAKKSKTKNKNRFNFELDGKDNAAFIPDADYSGDSDVTDLDEPIGIALEEQDNTDSYEDESDNDCDLFTPTKSYSRISSEYNNTQKKLEKNYPYKWIPGEKKSDILQNEIFLSHKDKQAIISKSFTELFEFYFCSKIKNYIIESTQRNGYSLSLDDLNTFIGIIIFSSYNKRPSQRDFWSTDPLLHAAPVAMAMSRNKFETIKSKLKFSLPEDNDPTNRAWRV